MISGQYFALRTYRDEAETIDLLKALQQMMSAQAFTAFYDEIARLNKALSDAEKLKYFIDRAYCIVFDPGAATTSAKTHQRVHHARRKLSQYVECCDLGEQSQDDAINKIRLWERGRRLAAQLKQSLSYQDKNIWNVFEDKAYTLPEAQYDLLAHIFDDQHFSAFTKEETSFCGWLLDSLDEPTHHWIDDIPQKFSTAAMRLILSVVMEKHLKRPGGIFISTGLMRCNFDARF